jgi:DNA-binding beta-propeller fold protein YncE
MSNRLSLRKILPFSILLASLFYITPAVPKGYSQSFVSRWGSLPPGNGEFKQPIGITVITVNASEKILVVDSGNHRIQVFDSNGGYEGQQGTLGTGTGQFNFPAGLAMDTSGNIYVADGANHRIQKFDSSGNYLTQWGSLGNGNGQFNLSLGLAVDLSQNVIYVTDANNNRI